MFRILLCFSIINLMIPYCKGQITSQLNQYLKSVYENHVMPGFSVVVVNKNSILYSSSYGYSDENQCERFTVNTINPIGSITKSITALAIMQLVEDGQIVLDDPLNKYLPEFTTANSERSNKVTVRMLLNNTSGLSGTITNTYELSQDYGSHILKDLSNYFISKEPGTSYKYSNLGYSIAGLIITKVTGMDYKDYVWDHVFSPLLMEHSSTVPIQSDDKSTGHFTGLKKGIAFTGDETLSGELIPAGRYTESTALDMAKYMRMYLNGGFINRTQFLSKEGIQEMWNGEVDFVGLSKNEGGDGSLYSYGLGWMISNIDGRKVIHHGGSTGTASSYMMFDPERGLGACILTNIDLTLIDRHQYAFGLHLINNVLHIAAGKKTSTYAFPKDPDKTQNDYQLPIQLKSKYSGFYKFKAGGDQFVYYDQPNIWIQIKDTKMMGTVYRNKQIVNEFELDFINPSLAVSRNIASPTLLRFIMDINNNIQGLHGFGMQLIKVDDTRREIRTKKTYEQMQISELPGWNAIYSDHLILTHAHAPGMKITCETSQDQPLKNSDAPIQTFRLNQRLWKKNTIKKSSNKSDKLMTTFTTDLGDHHLVIKYISQAADHSYYLMKDVIYFLNQLEFIVK